jgi:hypothetical protein
MSLDPWASGNKSGNGYDLDGLGKFDQIDLSF